MSFEYKYVTIELPDEQRQLVDMGMVKLESVNDMIMEVVNQEAAQNWEPMYPFMFPCLWFKRTRPARVRKKTTKKIDNSS